jgi:diguanylate cyclase (GGDEF)-like protein/PAS domain S-box-containing protein
MAGDKSQRRTELERLRKRVRELEASEARERERASVLHAERDRFLQFIERAPYGVLHVSATGKIEYLNRQFTAITGYTTNDLATVRTFLRKAFPNRRYRHEVLAEWKRGMGKGASAWFPVVCKDGNTREVDFRPTLFEEGKLVVMIFDVSERKRWEDAIRYMAYHDALTDLPNRLLLNELLVSALLKAKSEKEKLGVMLIDLDNFKNVNDRYGHIAGDVLLRSIASRVRELLRATDTVARVGGDEFVVLLPSIHDSEDVVQVAEKIAGALEAPVSYQNQPLTISASMGGAVFPDDGEDAEMLVGKADNAMYAAKGRKDKKYVVCGR